jgi:DNA-binding transcriptional regulator YdaS (Cro superfamily)
MDTGSPITPGSVIDHLGGTSAVAEALALADSTVSGWRERGIPPARCLALARLASERGRSEITLETLHELAERPAEARA